jgi:gliding motility associated protien GldN
MSAGVACLKHQAMRSDASILFLALYAQADPTLAQSGKFEPSRPVPYAHIREADVMWARRVWHMIDLREKMNLPLYYPETPIEGRGSLFDVIRNAVLSDGMITAYDDRIGRGDEFLTPLSMDQVRDLLMRTDTIFTTDIDTGGTVWVAATRPVEGRDLLAYKIKEDWIFDRQRSVLDIRIIGIAPVVADLGPDGEVRGHRTLFWLYYPECRHVLSAHEAFDRLNDANRLSLEEFITQRRFRSQVIKVANVHDRDIHEHQTGLDALLEAERQLRSLAVFEPDLWHH